MNRRNFLKALTASPLIARGPALFSLLAFVPPVGAVSVRKSCCNQQLGWWAGPSGNGVAESRFFFYMDGSQPKQYARVPHCTCGAPFGYLTRDYSKVQA